VDSAGCWKLAWSKQIASKRLTVCSRWRLTGFLLQMRWQHGRRGPSLRQLLVRQVRHRVAPPHALPHAEDCVEVLPARISTRQPPVSPSHQCTHVRSSSSLSPSCQPAAAAGMLTAKANNLVCWVTFTPTEQHTTERTAEVDCWMIQTTAPAAGEGL
jgi:hypothetical protein